MLFNNVRLALNLFGLPTALASLGLYAGSAIEPFNSHVYLRPIVSVIEWLALGALLVASVLFLSGGWRLWRALSGEGENCYSCGMPTMLIDPGKYSPHYRCMACGTNRRAYL
jgi:hypothetical protein